MKKKFKVGDQVVMGFNYAEDTFCLIQLDGVSYDYEELSGEITAILSKGMVCVKMDEGKEVEEDKRLEEIPTKFLILKSEAKQYISKLEKEFKAVEKQITSIMKEAGRNIKEANRLAKTVGADLGDMYEVISPLLTEMNRAGWNSSSC